MTDALMREDCTTGEPAPPRDDLLEILGRAYPRSAPGVLTSLGGRRGCRLAGHRRRAQLRARSVDPRQPPDTADASEATGYITGDYDLSTEG